MIETMQKEQAQIDHSCHRDWKTSKMYWSIDFKIDYDYFQDANNWSNIIYKWILVYDLFLWTKWVKSLEF